MDIEIGGNYRLVSDPNNLILLRKRVSDPNHHFSNGVSKVSWDVEGYFGRVEYIANRMVDKDILLSDAASLEELKNEVKEAKEAITKQLSQLLHYMKKAVEDTEEDSNEKPAEELV